MPGNPSPGTREQPRVFACVITDFLREMEFFCHENTNYFSTFQINLFLQTCVEIRTACIVGILGDPKMNSVVIEPLLIIF